MTRINSKLFQHVLFFFLLANFMLSFISNYSTVTLIFKAIFFITSILLLVSNISINTINHTFQLNKSQILFILFLVFLTFSILWSENRIFGFLKFYQLIIAFIPNVLVITFHRQLFNKINFLILSKYLLLLLTFLAIFTIFVPPVKFENFILTKNFISHVFLGRLFIIAIIINLYFILFCESQFKIIYFISFFVQTLALNQIALRSGIFATFFLILTLLILFRQNRSFTSHVLVILLIFITSLAINFFLFKNLKNRLPDPFVVTSLSLFSKDSIKDITISARIDGVKEGYRLFLDNFVFGSGLGAFNSSTEFRQLMKYPHNIFIEIAAENGIIGLIMFLLLLILLIRYINNFNFQMKCMLWIIFIYYFLLAQFSKDLSTNFQIFSLLFLNDNEKTTFR